MRVYMDDLIESLSKERATTGKIIDSLKKMKKEESDQFKRLTMLTTEISTIEKNLNQSVLDPAIKEKIQFVLTTSKSEVHEIEQGAKSQFGSKLAILLNMKGFNLEGNYPKLRASLYSFNVDILANKTDIYYGPEFEKIGTANSIPDNVASIVLKHYEMLNLREFDDKKFLNDLLSSYKICLIQNNKKIGDEIPIPEALSAYAFVTQDRKFKMNPLKKHYAEYDRILFSYDLHRLKERMISGFELKLITAKRADTKNRLDFLWIPSVREKGIGESISGLKFEEAK